MKINFNFSKKENNLKKDNYQINADFYWRLILFSSLLLVLGFFIFGFILFQKTNNSLESNLSVQEDFSKDSNVLLKKERIEKVLEIFDKRKSEYLKIITYPSEVVDPSL